MTLSIENLPVIKETRAQSLGQEDPLEKSMETHSSSLALRGPWIEKPGGLQFIGSQIQTQLKHVSTPIRKGTVEVKVVQSCPTVCNPMEFMEFSRPEYWSG